LKKFLIAVALFVTLAFAGQIAAQSKADEAKTPEKPEVQLTAAQLDAVSGEYADAQEPDQPASFYARDGKLYMESERSAPVALKATSATEFEFPQYKVSFHFTLDASGHGTQVSMPSDPERASRQRTGPAIHHEFPEYVRTEAMVPVRDGVKLHVVIFAPKAGTPLAAKPLPILLERTPYGVDQGTADSVVPRRPELARDGYIFVNADIRGRYKSEGNFEMNRALQDHTNPKNVDESTDAYDTADWLVKNVPNNNGRIGVLGTSYDGFTAVEAGIDPHPAVKAISPQAPMIDAWMGDDFFHNGAFRQTYGYDYIILTELTKENSEVDYGKDKDGKPKDGYDFFLEGGSFEQIVKRSGIKMLPTWETFFNHPVYDEVWRAHGVENTLKTVAVPTLTVGGYYDQEDMWGPQEEYKRLEPHDTQHINFLVLGPWRHGSWAQTTRHLGALDYTRPIGKEFRRDIEAKFFAHYLKDESGFDVENTASFQTGSNQWKRYSHFPPKEAVPMPLHLEGDGKASWADPSADTKTSYFSDPANPVPFRPRPIQPTYGPGSKWYTWMVEDQRFVEGRKDVALWRLPVLKKDLVVTGEVMADLFAATTGSDGDFVVKLIDEYPADDADVTMRGFELMTNAEIFRGRYLESFEKPSALRPNSTREYKFSLHDVDHIIDRKSTRLNSSHV